MYQRTRAEWLKHLDFLLIDFLCLHISYILAYLFRFPGKGLPYGNNDYLLLILLLSVIQIMASIALNSHGGIYKRSLLAEIIQVGLLTFSMLALISLFLFTIHTAGRYSRLLVYWSLLIFSVLDTVARCIFKAKGIRSRKSILSKRSMLIVTEAEYAPELIREIRNDPDSAYAIKGLVLPDTEEEREIDGVKTVADPEHAADYICREWVDEVLMFLPSGGNFSAQLLNECAEMGVTVHTLINLKNVDRSKQFIEEIGNRTFLTSAFNYINPYQAFLKRCLDILGGLVGSLMAVLIGIIIGPLIYINSPGPILFKQPRIGRNGKEFKVLKFRSMYLDADARKKEFMSQNRIADGMMFKLDFDPRIIGNKVMPDGSHKTGIGEFIRKTSLDEFPQFFNVLKGEMSLVGTRPPTVDEWERYQYHHRARLAIKPGITGMWQVSGRSQITDFEEVVKLDTEYICNFRLSLDIKILFKTVLVLLQRKGAM